MDFSAFSRQGLIDQLSSDYGSGYKVDDAAWAVSQLTVDWNKQAIRAAKEYLDFSSVSRPDSSSSCRAHPAASSQFQKRPTR